MAKSLIVVLGPTGVGKTALCLDIATHLHIPIINADSRQIFSELPIGTAAPTKAQQERVPHYFVGNHHIEDYYSASMYEQDVLALLDHLFSKSDTALLTGGSMLYIDAVCKGIDDIPTVDETTRATIMADYRQKGLPALVEELHRLDPEHWAVVDKRNPRRVIHAVEICRMTGQTYTSFRHHTIKKRPFNILKIGLNRDREDLYERINVRVENMMAEGLEEEARVVYPKKGLNALNTVGYKELFDYFEGVTDKAEAVRRIQSNTRRYMRKQLTWFKRDQDIHWMNPDNIKEIINYIDGRIALANK
ncbi:tRNA (adenosine(37)-N6)-dimethylallyltransferase MiaA [Prevotella cerevisiae]|jgi:tRNA dimethylallyltransferase|uniref:tRNA dimethylallyltransferase n=1 Tax=Segatella cerevisiae TaxID=2053716 RepID=A0ABT1BVR7_9BACT|nr:tRNA (adenosine(37)-N6)-dimethylallyltransferase MiaA [Segatella cerevisiae]MCO6025151.1 tRNA (adenosine(37)-N6)-dimethylallyltransferase MiaA [Segatella cerevisiae]